MRLFKATFSIFFKGSLVGFRDVADSGEISRFFEAQNIICARKIAKAMIGEEFIPSEILH